MRKFDKITIELSYCNTVLTLRLFLAVSAVQLMSVQRPNFPVVLRCVHVREGPRCGGGKQLLRYYASY